MELGERGRRRRPRRDRLVRHRAVAVLLAGAAGLAVLGAALVVLPGVVVDHDLGGASVAVRDRLKAVNDVRTTLLQAVGAWSSSSARTPPGGNCGSARSTCGTPISRRRSCAGPRCVLADLRGARLVEADLREADAGGAVFLRADLRLSDLRGCDLSTADLRPQG